MVKIKSKLRKLDKVINDPSSTEGEKKAAQNLKKAILKKYNINDYTTPESFDELLESIEPELNEIKEAFKEAGEKLKESFANALVKWSEEIAKGLKKW